MSAPLQQQQPQQNVVHQPPPQQQPPHMNNTNDILSIQSDFSILHHPGKKIDKQIETKYDILFTCLEVNEEWKLIKKDSGGTVLVSPDTNYDDLENLFEGVSYINSFAYGHRKSDETLERCNELYFKNVVGTKLGRGLIQRHVSSLTLPSTPPTAPPRVDQKCKELADDSFDLMMGKLSLAELTPLQQNEEAIVAAKMLLERLETNHEVLLRQEKKRQLELVSHKELEQLRHPSTNDNTKEKKQRIEKEEDDVVDDSINTAQDMEFEASIDTEFDNESESMLLDNKDVSASNYMDEEDQAPQDEFTTPMCASSMDIDSNPEVSTWPPSELQQQIDELENSKQINHIISSDDNLNKKMQLLLQELNNNGGVGFHLFIKLVSSHPATKVVLWTRSSDYNSIELIKSGFEAQIRKGVMGYQHLQRHDDGVDYILFPIIVGAKGISVGSASGYDAAQEPFDELCRLVSQLNNVIVLMTEWERLHRDPSIALDRERTLLSAGANRVRYMKHWDKSIEDLFRSLLEVAQNKDTQRAIATEKDAAKGLRASLSDIVRDKQTEMNGKSIDNQALMRQQGTDENDWLRKSALRGGLINIKDSMDMTDLHTIYARMNNGSDADTEATEFHKKVQLRGPHPLLSTLTQPTHVCIQRSSKDDEREFIFVNEFEKYNAHQSAMNYTYLSELNYLRDDVDCAIVDVIGSRDVDWREEMAVFSELATHPLVLSLTLTNPPRFSSFSSYNGFIHELCKLSNTSLLPTECYGLEDRYMEIADAEQSRKDNLASNLQVKTNNYQSDDPFIRDMAKLGNYTSNSRNDSIKLGTGRRKRTAATLLAMPSAKS